MERKFYTDNLEKLLKENADQFKMYPSKKVWHGLYNDLHPGKRWPSITMSIIFLFSLVIISHLNTSNNHRQQYADNSQKSTKQVTLPRKNSDHGPVSFNKLSGNIDHDLNDPSNSERGDLSDKELSETSPGLTGPMFPSLQISGDHNSAYITLPAVSNVQSASSYHPTETSSVSNKDYSEITAKTDRGLTPPSNGSQDNSADLKKKIPENGSESLAIVARDAKVLLPVQDVVGNPVVPSSGTSVILITSNEKDLSDKNDHLVPGLYGPANSVSTPVVSKLPIKPVSIPTKRTEVKKEESSGNTTSILPKLKKEKIHFTLFLTPSMSYRTLVAADVLNTVQLNAPLFATNADIKNSIQRASFGGEIGAIANYKVSKKIEFLTGLQLNYSQFNIIANHTHPTMATLYLNSQSTGSPYTISAISFYGNNTSTSQSAEATLHNYSFQASLPLGFQYKISGNDKIQLHFAATFQPSFIISSQSYLLSTDKRNYMTDPDLLRKWNMNTSFGTYLSFKINNLNWQVGPQLRYQVLSTYSPDYSGKEHLIDYGIRFGLNKTINR